MVRSVVAKVKELQVDYNAEQITHRLLTEGHNYDVVEAAIKVAFDSNLADERPPESYDDIRHIIQATLYSEPPRKVVKALTCTTSLGQIMPVSTADKLGLEACIAYIQSQRSEAVLEEIHKSLSPFVENMVINLSLAAQEESLFTYASSELERQTWDQWYEWFGIWLPETQKAFTKKAATEGNEIIAEVYEDGSEYTYCPKYDTEINVHSVCRASKCPFYNEIRTASGESHKFCKFKK